MPSFTVQSEINEKNVRPDFYDRVAGIENPLPFPSPVNDPKWLDQTVQWFCTGDSVMEVGPGRGEFAEAVIKNENAPGTYYIVDMSEKMLGLTLRRLKSINTKTKIIGVHADVDRESLDEIPPRSLDRIIMNNSFQDIQPDSALKKYHRLLSPGGLFRANVPDREAREKANRFRPFYDADKGVFYMTNTPSSIDSKEITPLGYVKDQNGSAVPYYRIMKSYYREEIKALFEENGLATILMEVLVLPKEVWLNSVAGQAAQNDPTRWNELKKDSRHFGSIEIIARRV